MESLPRSYVVRWTIEKSMTEIMVYSLFMRGKEMKVRVDEKEYPNIDQVRIVVESQEVMSDGLETIVRDHETVIELKIKDNEQGGTK